MTNVKTCDRCKKDFIVEEFLNHDCHIQFVDMKNIVVDYYFESKHKDENGDKVIMAKGLDGILYRLVHCTHNPPHVIPSNRDLTDEKNNRRPNRI